MGFGIDRHARSRKGRGLFRKAPDPKEVGERLARLARRMEKGAVLRAGWKKDRYVAEIQLHPNAPPATITVQPDAELALIAETSSVGPGYHVDVIARMAPLLDELDYVWADRGGELDAIQRDMCAWLANELRGEGQIRIGLGARRFRIDAPVLTPLGPRDAAWRDAVLADPQRAADAFAWWQTGAGQAVRARALLALWLEVPWREPLDGDERELLKRVDEDLRAARKADATLELPWAEWKELLGNIGVEDEEVNARAGDRVASIGYRRHDLEVELSGGWSVTMPGVMVGKWEDDGARYWATDGDRALEFTSFTVEDESDSDRLLAVAPEQHPVVARFSEGDRRGRAEAHDHETEGMPDVHIVIGLMACAPHVGILTVKGGDPEWALATWRSLRQR